MPNPPSRPSTPRVAVVGLGKLGTPIAAALAARGVHTVGYDLDADKTAALRERCAAFREPRLDEMLGQAGECLDAVDDLDAAVDRTDLAMVIVPTPSEPQGGFSLQHLVPAVQEIGRALAARPHKPYDVVITSTVMPGATGGPIRQALEDAAGRPVGQHGLRLCYSPEFIALGRVIDASLRPDLVLIGEHLPGDGQGLEAVTSALTLNRPPVRRMTLASAELVKLALNTYVTTKITFANLLAELCRSLPGADADVVTEALGLDRRIAAPGLKPGVSFGGPCFPRDNRALARFAQDHGVDRELPDAVDAFNRQLPQRWADRIAQRLEPGATVALLGLAYKTDTDVTEQSFGLAVAEHLANAGLRVVGYDPALAETGRASLGPVALAPTMQEAVACGDAVAIATPWPEFAQLDAAMLRRLGPRRVVFDGWRMLDPQRIGQVADYLAVGVADKDTQDQAAPALALTSAA
ncbi:MAG: nucleotide sugar dehydrogenase [Planctomycetota bacterium]